MNRLKTSQNWKIQDKSSHSASDDSELENDDKSSNSTSESNSTNAESESESSGDLEEGKLSFGNVEPPTQNVIQNDDPDVMRRTGASQYYPPERYTGGQNFEIEQGYPIDNILKTNKKEEGTQTPWGVLCTVCIMIALVIGAGVGVSIIFLGNTPEPTSSPTSVPFTNRPIQTPVPVPTTSPPTLFTPTSDPQEPTLPTTNPPATTPPPVPTTTTSPPSSDGRPTSVPREPTPSPDNGGSGGGGGGSGDTLGDLISSNSPDGGAALQDRNSPQYAALEWLRRPINEGFSDERLLQRYALAVLFYATGGDTGKWTTTSLWLSGSSECQWYSTSESTVICTGGAGGSDNLYLELDLRQNGLDGSLPAEIGMLTTLQRMRLQQNTLSGSLPSTLADLNQLEYLDLSSNRFTEEEPPTNKDNIFNAAGGGVLFSRIGDMGSLTHLSLFENLIQSTIPSEIGLLSDKLRNLDLGSNAIFGTIPQEVGLLTNLVGLSVFDNMLSGSLPEGLSDLQNLEMLYIDSNDLGPPIPLGICQLTTLREFWSDCEETGCVCCTTCCSDGFGCVET